MSRTDKDVPYDVQILYRNSTECKFQHRHDLLGSTQPGDLEATFSVLLTQKEYEIYKPQIDDWYYNSLIQKYPPDDYLIVANQSKECVKFSKKHYVRLNYKIYNLIKYSVYCSNSQYYDRATMCDKRDGRVATCTPIIFDYSKTGKNKLYKNHCHCGMCRHPKYKRRNIKQQLKQICKINHNSDSIEDAVEKIW